MHTNSLVLGLDIGVASIGWALANPDERRIEAAGVRIFDSAMDSAKFERGEQGASHATARRQARLQRRQIRRRAARHRDLYLALQRAGLLPFAGTTAANRHETLAQLDRQLMHSWRTRIGHEKPEIADPDQILCYYLRSRAAECKLERYELGRAFYHLGQRRGFQSNRREGRAAILTDKNNGEDEKERSEIKASINDLGVRLRESGLTLGQHLAMVNPHLFAIRNRKRSDMAPIWTGRAMYKEEFDRIWAAQVQHYPDILTDALHARISKLMFWHRSISTGKPGRCELEPSVDRAPRSSLLAQHFRVVQAVNNLRINEVGATRKLSADERKKLIEILSTVITEGKRRTSELFGLKFTAVKEILALSNRAKLNLDNDDESTYLRGNRTKALMLRAFGKDRWETMSDAEQRRIVRRWIKEPSPDKLLIIATTKWGLAKEAAERLVSTEPENGYAALSHVAMLKLLPVMEQDGLAYAETVANIYGNRFSGGEPKEYLPPVDQVLGHILNPAVMRALTELRKVVNAVVREYGKPAQIRIELARNLKRNAEQREREWKINRKRERDRKWAKGVLENDLHRRASRDAIDRILLYRDCKGVCVYCGLSLGEGYADLFSDGSSIELEHVLPRRLLDNSFSNKVLAHRACNIRKGDRTPFQAFGNEAGWEDMLARVEALGDRAKLDRFKIAAEHELADFSSRHLADTRYATKLATEYVEQLYGGRDAVLPWQDRNRRCVYASSGTLTSILRRGWGLEVILKEPAPAANGQGGKERSDHRHHAIDALVIALTSEAVVQAAAKDARSHDRNHGHVLPRYFSPPWPVVGNIEDRIKLFQSNVRDVIQTVNVSHRPNRKLNGPLHQATYYSPKQRDGDRDVFVRTAVQALTVANIEADDIIVNEGVRLAIRTKLAEVGDPKKFETSLPHLETRRGAIPIRYVRIRVPGSMAISVRNGNNEPSVFTEGNHHVPIFATDDPKKGRIWYTPGPPVTRMEAMRRKRTGDIVNKADGRSSSFVFYLMQGEMVEMLDKVNDRRDLYVVASLSENDYAFVRHTKVMASAKAQGMTLGALRKKMQDAGDRIRIRSIDDLRLRDCRKVEVDPLGRVHYMERRPRARSEAAR